MSNTLVYSRPDVEFRPSVWINSHTCVHGVAGGHCAHEKSVDSLLLGLTDKENNGFPCGKRIEQHKLCRGRDDPRRTRRVQRVYRRAEGDRQQSALVSEAKHDYQTRALSAYGIEWSAPAERRGFIKGQQFHVR